jgi:hypothetical protein
VTPYAAGWFPDPMRRYDYRYFDGSSWTSDVATAGHRYRDPLQLTLATAAPRTFAVASFVIGLVSLVAATLPFISLVAPVSALLGVVFAGVALNRHRRRTGRGKGFALWGLCLSLAAAPASVLGITQTTPAFIRAFNLVVNGEPPTVTIPVCETRNGTPYAEVTVRNIDSTAASYLVTVVFAESLGGTDTTVGQVDIAVNTVAPGASRHYRATAPVQLRHELLCSYRASIDGFSTS